MTRHDPLHVQVERTRRALAGLVRPDSDGLTPLQRAHDDCLHPRSRTLDNDRVANSTAAPTPRAGDTTGLKAYADAVHDIARAAQRIGAQLPAIDLGSTPHPRAAADLIRHTAETLAAPLPARRADRRRLEAACGALAHAAEVIRWAAHTRPRAEHRPTCLTDNCTDTPTRKMPEPPTGDGTIRCGGCHRYWYRYGTYPTIVGGSGA